MKIGRIKKIVAVVLAAAMTAGCLAACGSDPTPPPASNVPVTSTAQPGETPAVSDASSGTSSLTIEQILDSTTKKPSKFTQEKNQKNISAVYFDEETQLATAGFIAGPEFLDIKDSKGNSVWTFKKEQITDIEESPITVNPILWRDYNLNTQIGLYKVTNGVYQVRGYDVTNMTIIEGRTGWIIVDPLLSTECAEAALKLARDNLGNKPIMAVIISSNNIDHYGGIKGVISESMVADKTLTIEKQIKSKRTVILAPKGFSEHAVTDGILASHIKGRIRNYMTGKFLNSVGATGSLGIGLGLGYSNGTISYIQPTHEIESSDETLTIDGVKMSFLLASDVLDSEIAMNIQFINQNTLFLTDCCCSALNEFYSSNNAKLHDGIDIAAFIMETHNKLKNGSSIVIESHNWPHTDVEGYLLDNASLYKYINDQTLMYLNQGYTEKEIANMVSFPSALSSQWFARQTYVPMSSLISAVCQKYVGTTNSNPVYLNVLEPTEYAKKVISYMGTADTVVAKAMDDFDNGEYQWVAELMMLVIYSNPSHIQAKYLCADALEQLAYQAESGTLRNSYLSAVYELRNGTTTTGAISTMTGADTLMSMSTEMLINYMSMLMDAEQARTYDTSFAIQITDTGESYIVYLHNGVMIYEKSNSEDASSIIKCKKVGLISILQKNKDNMDKYVTVEGDGSLLDKITSFMVSLPSTFNVIEP